MDLVWRALARKILAWIALTCRNFATGAFLDGCCIICIFAQRWASILNESYLHYIVTHFLLCQKFNKYHTNGPIFNRFFFRRKSARLLKWLIFSQDNILTSNQPAPLCDSSLKFMLLPTYQMLPLLCISENFRTAHKTLPFFPETHS